MTYMTTQIRVPLLLITIAGIGWIDYISGPDIGFSLFYLVPVVLAGWLDGHIPAAITAVMAAAAWFTADFLAHGPDRLLVTSWNGFTRLAIFLLIGLMMARLRADREQLKRAYQELETFSYSVSHDLRSPLIHMREFADMLTRRIGGSLDETSGRQLRNILDASNEGLQLVDDLLAFSKLDRAAMKRAPVNLSAIVEDVRSELDARPVSWSVGPLPTVTGDPSMLRLVIRNLLENAVKYSRRAPEPRIEIGSFEAQGEQVVFVRDNGVGFDPRYSGKLFRLFERLHGSEEFEGTGIGLATVKRIVERHGGRAWAEGQLGAGAAFYFTVPER